MPAPYTYPIVHEVTHNMHALDGDYAFKLSRDEEDRIARDRERWERQRVAKKPYRHIRVTPE